MRRPLLILLLLAAAGGTGLLAVQMLDDAPGESRHERGAAEIDAEEPRRGKTEPEPAPDRPAVRTSWPVAGFVLDRADRGIEGALVRATTLADRHALEAVTDRAGRYELIMPGPAFHFDVLARGYLPVIGTVNGRSNGTQDFVCDAAGPWGRDFVLESAASVLGRVMDEGGAGVPGATVYAISPEHQVLDVRHAGNVVRADQRGFYRFPGLAAGTYDIGVVTGIWRPAMHRDVVVPERGEVRRDFTLARGREVAVTVRNATDNSRVVGSDARLRAKLLPPGGLEALAPALVGREFIDLPVVVVPVAEGEARLRGLPPGPVDVEARDPARITEPGLSSLLATTEPALELTLVPARAVPLTVLDASTRERLEPDIRRETQGAEGRLPVEWRGDVALLPFDDRRHTLRFELDGYEVARLELPPSALEWPASFEVLMQRVADADTGAFYVLLEPPLDGRIAVVGRDAGGRQRWVRHVDEADAQGRWAVEKVPVGEYTVNVLATGMIPVALSGVVVSPGIRTTHRVLLTRGGGLAFKVTDADGKLLEKVHLLLEDEFDRRIDVHILTKVSEGRAFLSVNYLPSAATASADSGLAPGAYTLAAYRADYEPATVSFVIRGTETTDVTVVLARR